MGHTAGTKTKLLEQPIPASFLKLEERVRVLATDLKRQAEPPLLKENKFREETSDIIANPRELDQAVTFLHENGELGISEFKTTEILRDLRGMDEIYDIIRM